MLDEKIESYLNNLGIDNLKKLLNMAEVEIFRNYCIHNFNWFKGGYNVGDQQHKCERTWMRFYIDHGRLPNNIDIEMIFAEKLNEDDVVKALNVIYDAYIDQYKFDILNPDRDRKRERMLLEGF